MPENYRYLFKLEIDNLTLSPDDVERVERALQKVILSEIASEEFAAGGTVFTPVMSRMLEASSSAGSGTAMDDGGGGSTGGAWVRRQRSVNENLISAIKTAFNL